MYTVTDDGKLIGKMNSEYLRRWLLKRRTETQTELTLQTLNVYGRATIGKVVIRRFVTKGE